jgi:glycosyltransferase involved in cell wall biosynthesis
MVVAHLGADPATFHPPSGDEVAAVRAHLGLGSRPWVAFVGTHEPRKNVPALIDGFVRAVRDRPDPPVLVLAGGQGWDQRVAPALAAVPPEVEVRRVGYLPLELLAGFLGGALLVAYPSLGEGFGLPVLEAMACAAAVLTTRRLSLPEVGGDAVAYTDVDAPAIAEALARLLDNPEQRRDLAAAGLRRSAMFTPEATARAHLAAYERAAARRGEERSRARRHQR